MLFQNSKNGQVRLAVTREIPVLKPNEGRNEQLPVFRPLKPAFQFGQVLFLYYCTEVERRRLRVKFDQPRTIAVIR